MYRRIVWLALVLFLLTPSFGRAADGPNSVYLPVIAGLPKAATATVQFSDAVDAEGNLINPRFGFSYGIKRLYLQVKVTDAVNTALRVEFQIGSGPSGPIKTDTIPGAAYVYNDSFASCQSSGCGISPLPRSSYTVLVYLDRKLITKETIFVF